MRNNSLDQWEQKNTKPDGIFRNEEQHLKLMKEKRRENYNLNINLAKQSSSRQLILD
jgi:hypothetical protein